MSLPTIDNAHNPKARNWVASANGHADFPLQNLALCRFILDGDEITLTGYCEAPGFTRIGLGEARGCVLPAPAL
jgi:fumarylacetoacetase